MISSRALHDNHRPYRYRAAMRYLSASILALSFCASTTAIAQTAAPSDRPARDGLAIGVIATPALEGGGPWVMPGVRVSMPCGPTHGFDFEAGRIFGGTSQFAVIRAFVAGQLRFTRNQSEDHATTKYWLAGLKYFNRRKLDGHGTGLEDDPDMALLLGHGWKQSFHNGVRAIAELGFGGGEGLMVYLSLGVQWGLPPRRAAPTTR